MTLGPEHLVLILALAFVILIISLGVSAVRKRWRRVIWLVALSVGTFLALRWSLLNVELLSLELWRVRLELSISRYLAEIDAIPATDSGPRVKAWFWGEWGSVAAANIFWTLVYDDSDQIALPRSRWSAEWLRKAEQARPPLFGPPPRAVCASAR